MLVQFIRNVSSYFLYLPKQRKQLDEREKKEKKIFFLFYLSSMCKSAFNYIMTLCTRPEKAWLALTDYVITIIYYFEKGDTTFEINQNLSTIWL